MRVSPFLARLRAYILEHSDVLKAGIFLQVDNSRRVSFESKLDIFVRQVFERHAMIGRLDDDLVGSNSRHAIVDSICGASGVALDAVHRPKVRKCTNLPFSFRGKRQQGVCLDAIFRAQRTRIGPVGGAFWMSYSTPTAGNRVLT